MSILSKPYFHDEAAAYEHLEGVIWPSGPICPHCGCFGRISKIKPNRDQRVRMGLKKCGDCKKQFTVKVGTVFEASKVKLHLWLQAVHLMTSSKKGISAHQLHRVLEVTYKTAWFMAHRIREAMRDGALAPMGGAGGIVEADETFIGHDQTIKPKGEKKGRGYAHKHKVLSLVDRKTGIARSIVVDDLRADTLVPILQDNILEETAVVTDEASQYRRLDESFADHDFVRHGAEEYVRGLVHTNTIEGYFSIFKRGMKGVYQHCAKKHLHRYTAEFAFRYSYRIACGFDDQDRTRIALRGIVGKRLTYRGSSMAL